MKKSPLILTLLSTNLILSSPQNAMEEQVILDRRVNDDGRSQILVLTPTGHMKAKALQESFDQEKERKYIPFHPEGLGEDPELAEAIRLSLEEQTPTPNNPTSSMSSEDPELAEGIRLSVLESQTTPTTYLTSSSVNEEEDPLFQKALSESGQDYKYQQKKVAEEKEALEKERLQKKRDEIRKELEKERELRSAQIQSLFSRIRELRMQEQQITDKFIPSSYSQQSTEEFLKTIRLQDEETKEIGNQISSIYTEIDSFEKIDDLIHEEVIRLIQGGEPRELPWMQQLTNSPVLLGSGTDQPLPSSTLPVSLSEGERVSSLPPIPSSALPKLNSGSTDKK
jgi:hypothetical protein